jgi:uncharacterized membrane protein
MERIEKSVEVACPVRTVYNQWTQFEEFPRSTSGAPNAGTVRFEPLSHDRTRVRLIMEYEPEGVVEKTGDAVGAFSARVQKGGRRGGKTIR